MLRLRIEVRCALLNAALSMTIQRGMKSGQINNQPFLLHALAFAADQDTGHTVSGFAGFG